MHSNQEANIGNRDDDLRNVERDIVPQLGDVEQFKLVYFDRAVDREPHSQQQQQK